PSPKSHAKPSASPSASDDAPASTEHTWNEQLTVNEATGAAFVGCAVCVTVSVAASLSGAVSVTVAAPAAGDACWTVAPSAGAPSPKLHWSRTMLPSGSVDGVASKVQVTCVHDIVKRAVGATFAGRGGGTAVLMPNSEVLPFVLVAVDVTALPRAA